VPLYIKEVRSAAMDAAQQQKQRLDAGSLFYGEAFICARSGIIGCKLQPWAPIPLALCKVKKPPAIRVQEKTRASMPHEIA
jgi:hypothetical protein